jgi:hypothetical protein
MTKLRLPLTPYRALAQIADLLGWDGCAAVLCKSESAVRKWADPDIEREISLRDAMRLDAAYLRAGGGRAPLYEVYGLRLNIRELSPATSQAELIAATGDAARESGEAVAAALRAVNDMAGHVTRQTAICEIEESIASLTCLLGKLRMEDI